MSRKTLPATPARWHSRHCLKLSPGVTWNRPLGISCALLMTQNNILGLTLIPTKCPTHSPSPSGTSSVTYVLLAVTSCQKGSSVTVVSADLSAWLSSERGCSGICPVRAWTGPVSPAFTAASLSCDGNWQRSGEL